MKSIIRMGKLGKSIIRKMEREMVYIKGGMKMDN